MAQQKKHPGVDCPRGSKPLENPESCEIASEVLRVKWAGDQPRFTTSYGQKDQWILWFQEMGNKNDVQRKIVAQYSDQQNPTEICQTWLNDLRDVSSHHQRLRTTAMTVDLSDNNDVIRMRHLLFPKS